MLFNVMKKKLCLQFPDLSFPVSFTISWCISVGGYGIFARLVGVEVDIFDILLACIEIYRTAHSFKELTTERSVWNLDQSFTVLWLCMSGWR